MKLWNVRIVGSESFTDCMYWGADRKEVTLAAAESFGVNIDQVKARRTRMLWNPRESEKTPPPYPMPDALWQYKKSRNTCLSIPRDKPMIVVATVATNKRRPL